MPNLQPMALRIAERRALPIFPTGEGTMRFQFDPESITETHGFDWTYEPIINENQPNPQPKGRSERTMTMKLVMLQRGIGFDRTGSASMRILTDVERIKERIENLSEEERFQRVDPFTGAPIQTFFGRRTEVGVPGFLFEARKAAKFKTLLKFSGVDLQLEWLKAVMRAHTVFQDQPPRLKLLWKTTDSFVCVLTDLKIQYLAWDPKSKAALHAEANITLKEASTDETAGPLFQKIFDLLTPS